MITPLIILLGSFCFDSNRYINDVPVIDEGYTIGTEVSENGPVNECSPAAAQRSANRCFGGGDLYFPDLIFPDTSFKKGALLYKNSFSRQSELNDWVMEGPGKLRFQNGWMGMFSPGKEWDHVFWCPEDFPSSFIAEWEMQNLDTSEGLTIVFFAAKGTKGEDIFDPSLPKRDGTFKFYNKGQINCYHISYYANNPKNPSREKANLRKDPMFALLQTGEVGIPAGSLNKHKIRLVKINAWIRMYVDSRKIIDYRDETNEYGAPCLSGKIGFRQMRWSHFRYRNFRVWDIKIKSK